MPTTMGIVGESTVTTVGSVTLYTVGANRAAKVRILHAIQGGASQLRYNHQVGTPGAQQSYSVNLAAGDDAFSGLLIAAAASARDIALHDGTGILPDIDNPLIDSPLIAPGPFDYFLSAGDTVVRVITTAEPDTILVQVHGVEDDV